MYRLRPFYESSIRFDDSFLNVLYRTPKFNTRTEVDIMQGIFLRNTGDAACGGDSGDSRFASIAKRAEDLSARMDKLSLTVGSTPTSSCHVGAGRLNQAEILLESDMRNLPYSFLLLATFAGFRVSVHAHSTLLVGDRFTAAERSAYETLQKWLKQSGSANRAENAPAIRLMLRETPVSDVFLNWNGLSKISGEVNLLRFLSAFGDGSAFPINSDTNNWLDAAELRFALATSRDRATFLKTYAAHLESTGKAGAKLGVLEAYVFTLILRTGFERSSWPRRVTIWFDELVAKYKECASLANFVSAAR